MNRFPSRNNKPVSEAIPLFKELFVPALKPFEPLTRPVVHRDTRTGEAVLSEKGATLWKGYPPQRRELFARIRSGLEGRHEERIGMLRSLGAMLALLMAMAPLVAAATLKIGETESGI